MREILFRGKRVDNGEWFEGFYILREDESPVGETIESYKQHLICTYDFGGLNEYEVFLETVGQFTGLCDKNGKKIFEGDILGYGSKIIGHIIGGVRGYCYDVVYKNPIDYGELDWSLYEIVVNDYKYQTEVIGNIHDNPELLTK